MAFLFGQVTAAPIGVILVSGPPQEMDHQRASIPALTNNMTNSCDSSEYRHSEGLHSENGQRRGRNRVRDGGARRGCNATVELPTIEFSFYGSFNIRLLHFLLYLAF